MANNLQTFLARCEQPISLPFETSYRQVCEELRRWRALTITQLDAMCERILTDMSSSFDDVHQFASLADGLLVEQQRQLERATTADEFDIIQDRLNIIIGEIQLLQCLSFRLDCDAVKLIGELNTTCNNDEMQLFSSNQLLNDCRATALSSDTSTSDDRSPTPSQHSTTYRLLVSRADAVELDKNSISNFHLSAYANKSIGEAVLTIDVMDLDSFLDAFDTYLTILPTNHDVRLLIPHQYIPLIMGELGKTARFLTRRFDLDQIKIFSNSCPKSDERVLLIQGQRIDYIKACIQEIYDKIEQSNSKYKTKFYNPESLSATEIEEMTMNAIDYGGFAVKQHQEHTRSSRTGSLNIDASSSKKESSSDDENNDEDDFADFRHVRGNDPEAICREILVNDIQAGVIIGVNATRIDSIKQKTGAYVYVRGDSNDPKRSVFIKGTRDQVERAVRTIEGLIECHKNDKLPMKQRRARGKNKTK